MLPVSFLLGSPDDESGIGNYVDDKSKQTTLGGEARRGEEETDYLVTRGNRVTTSASTCGYF